MAISVIVLLALIIIFSRIIKANKEHASVVSNAAQRKIDTLLGEAIGYVSFGTNSGNEPWPGDDSNNTARDSYMDQQMEESRKWLFQYSGRLCLLPGNMV